MKLLVFLMLTALPLYCYAGSGCNHLEELVTKALDSSVTPEEYLTYFQEYRLHEDTLNAVVDMKQCFNRQTEDVLESNRIVMETIYNSASCSAF
ncbi:mammaglobin-B-like [Sorex araneus]|uniref:mammaglobin-B-like n=1 Tax=Sorex araneus TaxID=42254 RepID=UPI002433FD64|nr:mammaglobin-B-like [Sorex araneus]